MRQGREGNRLGGRRVEGRTISSLHSPLEIGRVDMTPIFRGHANSPQLIEINPPILSCRLRSRLSGGRRMERDVNGDTAVEDDRCGVLIEEGLDADDLVAWV